MSIAHRLMSIASTVGIAAKKMRKMHRCAIAGYLMPNRISMWAEDADVLIEETVLVNIAALYRSSGNLVFCKKGLELNKYLRTHNWECPEISYLKRYRMNGKMAKYFLGDKIHNLPIQAFFVGEDLQ